MDLNNEKDFAQLFDAYCLSISLSCHGCKIAKLIGIKGARLRHNCWTWAEEHKDVVIPILQDWWEYEPFIPRKGVEYYSVSRYGYAVGKVFTGSPEDYANVLLKNCYRTITAALNHSNEMAAKCDAIDNGKWPD